MTEERLLESLFGRWHLAFIDVSRYLRVGIFFLGLVVVASSTARNSAKGRTSTLVDIGNTQETKTSSRDGGDASGGKDGKEDEGKDRVHHGWIDR